MVVIKGKELLFDNYTWHEYVKRVDWENIIGSSNQAALYGAMASAAYSAGTEKPEWKEAGEFLRTFSDADKKKLKEAFEAMNEYKILVSELEKAKAETPVETKKKRLKASAKT